VWTALEALRVKRRRHPRKTGDLNFGDAEMNVNGLLPRTTKTEMERGKHERRRRPVVRHRHDETRKNRKTVWGRSVAPVSKSALPNRIQIWQNGCRFWNRSYPSN
jgi:hypothetical protein